MKNFLYLFLAAFVFYSCNSNTETADTAETETTGTETAANPDPNQLGTDMINNPNTGAEVNEPAPGNAKFEFDKTEHDFGKISQDNKVSHTFKFKNTGTEPLIISEAKGSCGCTVPEYSKEPIPVGETGEIQVEFDPKGKKGIQRKTVTVTANTTPNRTTLQVVSDIVPAEGEEAAAN